MTTRALLAVPLLVAAAISSADKVYQPTGATPPVKAKKIRGAAFVPLIDSNVDKARLIQPENELKWNYNAGEPNTMGIGGLLGEFRVGTQNSTFFPTNGVTGYEPPDPDLAAGKSAVGVVVNDTIGFYSKTGKQLLLKPLGDFFKSVNPTPFVFDPKINYDPGTGRFYVVALEQDDATKQSHFLIGVSGGEDPLGSWNLYRVDNAQTQGGGAHWLDYPGWGFNGDSIVASGNMFPFGGETGNVYTSIFVFKKSELAAGTAAGTRFDIDDFTVQLAKTFGSGPYTYGVATNYQSQSAMSVYAVKTVAPMSVTSTTVAVPTWQPQGNSVDPGGHVTGGFDPRILNSAYRNGHVVATQSVGVSASDSRGAARWYDFTVGTWPASGTVTLAQSGQINPPASAFYLFPAINIDVDGNLGMTFTKVDTNQGYTMMGSGRKKSDAPGAMGAPSVLETGLSKNYKGFSGRWGDYHDIEIDPTDQRKFWAVGMAPDANGRWLTFAKSFNVVIGEDAATVVNARDAAAFSGTLRSGDGQSMWASDGTVLIVGSQTIQGIGRAAGVVSHFVSPVNAANTDFLRARIKVAAPSGSTVTLFVRNLITGQMDVVKAIIPTGNEQSIDIDASAFGKYVGSNGEIEAALRCVLPPRNGKSPAPFDLKVDRFAFLVLPKPAP